MNDSDEFWMNYAISAAKSAESIGEVPIGACIIGETGELLSSSGNRTITDRDPTAHAEILALRQAAAKINNYRLVNSTVYSTIEPCAMCAGALVNARVKRLVYGAKDERFGAVETHFNICSSSFLNHQIEIVSGVSAEDCRKLMQDFFRKKREFNKLKKIIINQT